MGSLAVLASGNGSNFEALARGLAAAGRHKVSRLICDRKAAYAFERAAALGIPSSYVGYKDRPREEAEADISAILEAEGCDLIALAGYMRIFTPAFSRRWRGMIINIHPSLLPRHPGARGIEDSWASGDRDLGITIHWVEEGLDSGPIILQRSFPRSEAASLEDAEERIHALEHRWYPTVANTLLDEINDPRRNGGSRA